MTGGETVLLDLLLQGVNISDRRYGKTLATKAYNQWLESRYAASGRIWLDLTSIWRQFGVGLASVWCRCTLGRLVR